VKISEKKVTKETYLWKPGLGQWEIAENIPNAIQRH
jgi:hypothetical protein